MCTLALAWQVFEDEPIAVAANRDEALDRPSEPPGRFGDDPTVLAPRDADAGGTWIGVNEHGLFAGITNRWTDANLERERSRGLLVADILERESTDEAVARVEREIEAREYGGFYLVVADAERSVCLGWDGDLERVDFDPGVHVVVNVGYDDRFDVPEYRETVGERQATNARSVRRALAVDSGEGAGDWLERAGGVLGDHEYGVCVHGDGFGTRSSSLLSVGETVRYDFADGPPCRVDYERAVDAVPLEALGERLDRRPDEDGP